MSKWFWMGDNGWLPFDAPKAKLLETEFSKGSKKVAMDKERYVDLSLTHAEIVKNFVGLSDKELIGIQRRYDDPTKRRAVKRVPPVSLYFFAGVSFVLFQVVLGKKLKKKEEELVATIKNHGGSVSTTLTKKTDYLVSTVTAPSYDEAQEADLYDYVAKGGYLVTEFFIEKCVVAGSKVDHTSFILTLPPVPKKEKKKAKDAEEEGDEGEEEDEEEVKKVVKKKDSKKRKDTDGEDGEDGEDEGKKGKKAKKAKTTATTASTTTTTAAKKSDTIDDNAASSFQAGSEWTGVCTYPENNEHFPFELEVVKTDGVKVEGLVFWKTLNDSQTKFRGTIKGKNLEIEEYEVVHGVDDVEVPMAYTGTVGDNVISGAVGEKSLKATFKMNLVKAAPSASLFSVWKGECTIEQPIILTVDTRTGDDLTGVVDYPALGVSTQWEGKVKENTLSIKEVKVILGDPKEVALAAWKCSLSADKKLLVGTGSSDKIEFMVA